MTQTLERYLKQRAMTQAQICQLSAVIGPLFLADLKAGQPRPLDDLCAALYDFAIGLGLDQTASPEQFPHMVADIYNAIAQEPAYTLKTA